MANPLLTSAQTAFMQDMALSNLDTRAVRGLVAAFEYRNKLAHHQLLSMGPSMQAFVEAIDEVAG